MWKCKTPRKRRSLTLGATAALGASQLPQARRGVNPQTRSCQLESYLQAERREAHGTEQSSFLKQQRSRLALHVARLALTMLTTCHSSRAQRKDCHKSDTLACVPHSCLSHGNVHAMLIVSFVRNSCQKTSQLAVQIGSHRGMSINIDLAYCASFLAAPILFAHAVANAMPTPKLRHGGFCRKACTRIANRTWNCQVKCISCNIILTLVLETNWPFSWKRV